MTRTRLLAALTLALCAAELRAQMAYPYISPPGLGSRGGRMAYRGVTYPAPTYAPTYRTTIVPTYGTTPAFGTVPTTTFFGRVQGGPTFVVPPPTALGTAPRVIYFR